MHRAIVIIDGDYLNRLLEDEFGKPSIDYAAFARRIAGNAEILRVYYHYCEPYQSNPATFEERERLTRTQKFLSALQYLPRFSVRLGRLEVRGIDSETGDRIYDQRRVDVQMSLDLVVHAIKGHADGTILVTGDGDIVPAVEIAKAEGNIVRVVHGSLYNRDLLRCADERHRLTDDDIEACLRAPQTPRLTEAYS